MGRSDFHLKHYTCLQYGECGQAA